MSRFSPFFPFFLSLCFYFFFFLSLFLVFVSRLCCFFSQFQLVSILFVSVTSKSMLWSFFSDAVTFFLFFFFSGEDPFFDSLRFEMGKCLINFSSQNLSVTRVVHKSTFWCRHRQKNKNTLSTMWWSGCFLSEPIYISLCDREFFLSRSLSLSCSTSTAHINDACVTQKHWNIQ